MHTHRICVLICATLISCIAHADVYQTVRIVAPESKTTVHDNSGNLVVTVDVSPPLHAEAGDRLTLMLDGKAVASGYDRHFELTAIERGSHTLRARVKAADGNILATSPPVKFYMWRASRLFRERKK